MYLESIFVIQVFSVVIWRLELIYFPYYYNWSSIIFSQTFKLKFVIKFTTK